MSVDQQATAVIATFAHRRRAGQFVEELRRAGFRDEEVGVLAPHGPADATKAEEGAVVGAVSGGALGAVAGAVATGLIPGIGPVLAVGLLAGVAGGAVTGAAAGGVVGALVGLGIPEPEARQYQQEVQAGRTLVVVQAPRRSGEALAVLRRCQAAD